MNSNKRKEGPNDNDRAKGAKRNKVCGMVPFFYTNIFRRNSNLGARMIETFCCEIQGAFECMIHQAYPICWLSSPYSYFTSGPHFLPPSQLIVDPHLIFTLCLTSIQGGSGGKWQTPHQQAKMASFRGEHGTIEPGDVGIWATCARGQEGKATIELRNMLQKVRGHLHGLDHCY